MNQPRQPFFPIIRRRKRRVGMTLVEIMIVVIIMALIAAAVGVAVLPRLQRAREEQTRTDAQAVRSAVILSVGENPNRGCPTVVDLVNGGYLDRSRRTTDAWDNAFTVVCEGFNITVASPGPDGQMSTDDDIQP